ncbi:hypothetical protein Csa_010234 [Cucumis sativus]|nr:hypothetical protein Csa_010234 [Cucumis sativus]
MFSHHRKITLLPLQVQTWNNRYFRNESVVVAEERPVDNEQRVRSEKPLLLPVRSLKSRVVVDDEFRSKKRVSSRRLLSNLKRSSNVEFGGVNNLDEIDDKLNENFVLPSPVPWRSRSGRMEKQEEADNPSMEDSESNRIGSRSPKPQTSKSSRASAIPQRLSPSPSPSPRKPSPSHNVSPELQAKSAEDLVRKKSFYRSPPPPPPPPPPRVRRTSSMKPSSWVNEDDVPHQKELRRSYTSKPRTITRDTGDDTDMMIGANSSGETQPRHYVDGLSMGKSVRTIRAGEAVNEPPRRGREFSVNDQLKGKTMMNENTHVQDFEENPLESPDEDKEELVEKLTMDTDVDEDDDDDMESEVEGNSMVGKFIREDNGEPFDVKRRNREDERGSSNEEEEEEEAGSSSNIGNDGGPDVDKKADEFIAKFREQIRLQRIESFKRSSGQIRKNTTKQS